MTKTKAEQDPAFTLDQLMIVRAIAAQGSFRRAADSLYLSQPAVSLQVQNLERQLGVTLFDRGGRQLRVTEAGQILVEYGERILTLCQETQLALADLQDMKRGTLQLGASQTVGTYVMPHLIGQFWQAYPQVSVQLLVQSTRRIARKLANGELDLAIVGGEVPTELQSAITVIPYACDEYVLVTAMSAPEGVWIQPPDPSPTVLQLSDLTRLRFITLDAQSSTRQTIDRSLQEHQINPHHFSVQIELSSIDAIKMAVGAELGVAFLSITAVGLDLERQTLKRLPVEGLDVKRTLRLLYNPERYQSRVAQLFREGLLQASDWLTTPHPYLEKMRSHTREE